MKRKGVVAEPVTLGEYLRNRRMALGLRQEDAAYKINTLREVYDRWERDEVVPVVSFWPRLIGFLGLYPGAAETPALKVLMARRLLGLSQYAFGRQVQAPAENIQEWERGMSIPSSSILGKIHKILADHSDVVTMSV